MEEYYQKVIQLQDRLRKSEEERLNLEIKFNEMVQSIKEEEEVHFKKLRSKYKKFIEEDRRRQQRNDKILQALDRIENRTAVWEAKTEKFKEFRKRYHNYMKHIKEIPHELDVPPVAKEPFATEEIINKYMDSISSQNCGDVKPPDKYSKLGNINSMYSKTLNSYDFSQTKTTKDQENALKQNSGLYEKPKPYTYDSELYHVNEFEPEESPQQTHNNLEQLLKDHSRCDETSYQTLQEISSEQPLYKSTGLIQQTLQKMTLSSTEFAPQIDVAETTHTQRSALYDDEGYENKNPHQIYPVKPQENKVEEKLPTENKPTIGVEIQPKAIENKEAYYNIAQPTVRLEQSPRNFSSPEKIPQNYYNKEAVKSVPHEIVHVLQKNYPVEQSLKEQCQYRKSPEQPYATTDQNHTQHNYKSSIVSNEHSSVQNKPYAPMRQAINVSSKEIIEPWKENKQENLQHKIQDQPTQSPEKQLFYQPDEHTQPLKQVRELALSGYEQYSEPSKNIQHIQQKHVYDQSQPDRNGQLVSEFGKITQDIKGYNSNEDSQYDGNNNQNTTQHNKNSEKQYHAESLQCDENGKTIQSYEQLDYNNYVKPPVLHEPAISLQQYDPAIKIQYNAAGQPVFQYDENGQLLQQYNQVEQLQYDENGQPILTYDETRHSALQYDENGQPIGQYDENGQLIGQYIENGQDLRQYDQVAQLQYDENGQPIPQYDETGQLLQHYGGADQLQYDENGQPVCQYDENGIPLPIYDQTGQLQYDENGIPLQIYDQTGLQYDENGQLVCQYDENGQPLQQYYDENSQPVQYYDQTVDQQYYEQNPNQSNQNESYQIEEHQKNKPEMQVEVEHNEDVQTKPQVQQYDQAEPTANTKTSSNVLDILETDTESLQQDTKVSNDSDFDFSNA